MDDHALLNDGTYGHAWIQGSIGILKHNLRLLGKLETFLLVTQILFLTTIQQLPLCRGVDAHESAPQCGFPAA